MRIETAGLACLLIVFVGCKGTTEASVAATKPSTTAASTTPTAIATGQTSGESTSQGLSGRHRDDPTNNWVPAEHKSGMARFKDPGVYADGVLVGMLKFGELPVPLEPVWKEEKASIPFGPGHKGPRYKIVKERRYRFTDYFKAVGIDVNRIKEVHIYGGSKRRASGVIAGEKLRSQQDDFAFRFGGDVWGKPIPSCSSRILSGKCPDNLTAVTVYIERKPPIRQGKGFVLDGEVIYNIPYYGEPTRGGVRVYLDNRLMTTIKRRQLLDESLSVTSTDGDISWKFFGFLKAQGVDTSAVTEAWLIHQNRRVHRLRREQLVEAVFVANAQRRGEILFGHDKIPANALALHTKPVSQDDLPVVLPHEG